ncbi:FAD-binding protein [Bradyrhizobium sp. AC87j1]|uniref:FAD-dependent oxidoreductase n=1 Tax=Bradyrhizobium sp. AC87j1 TaxID=2055894 RepID=UPI001FE150F5|nr:FAD-binding protein [Bradyrhizobium sp. AC87j1]
MISSSLEELSITADVLIVGGGMAGAWAAASAAQAGAKVILADKGYCGTSGVTAAAGPGHWWVPPDPPAARDTVVANRVAAGLGLGEAEWMYRILDQTWRTLPTLARHYKFGVDDEGRVNYRAVRGPEYMRALSQHVLGHGVTILDHSPVIELLARSDGSIGGARGLRRQDGGRAYRIEVGAVVLAAGGTSFLSHLLGSQTNTGDGYLMASEAGAEMSGMEFTAAYTIAPAHSTMTRSMAYSFAAYYDADGQELDLPFGPDQTIRLARALQRGPVYCSLHRLPDDVKARLHTISPNVPLVFDRWEIDPYATGSRSPCTMTALFAALAGYGCMMWMARRRCRDCSSPATTLRAKRSRARSPAAATSIRHGRCHQACSQGKRPRAWHAARMGAPRSSGRLAGLGSVRAA